MTPKSYPHETNGYDSIRAEIVTTALPEDAVMHPTYRVHAWFHLNQAWQYEAFSLVGCSDAEMAVKWASEQCGERPYEVFVELDVPRDPEFLEVRVEQLFRIAGAAPPEESDSHPNEYFPTWPPGSTKPSTLSDS